jgi:hypothetical protein
MDHGVGPFELSGIQATGGRVPLDLTRARPAAHQPCDLMSAGGEEWNQSASDQAGRPADDDLEARFWGIAPMSFEVGLEQKVPVLQHPFESGANGPSSDNGPGWTERRGVFDSVGQAASVRPHRIEDMQVDPARKGTLHLLVRELASGDAVSVAGQPAECERAPGDPEHNLATVLQPTPSLDDLDPFPRGQQSLEGTRALVPGERLTSGHRQSAGAFDRGQHGRRR